MKKALNVLKMSALAAVAAVALSGTANAQSLVRGSFTLPYEVHWGKTVLAPGAYVITMDNTRGPAIIRTATGSGVGFVLARATGSALASQPTALLISQHENQRFVHSFNWREGNTEFVYQSYTSAERKLLGKVDTLAVPIRMAQK
jgi:hypothetical protein